MTSSLTVPTAPPLAHRPGVELMRAGQWESYTGLHTFTREDFLAAVAALECPAVRNPVLKLGHDGNHGVGEPAVGWISNLGATGDGSVLVGDYTGMPGWLGDVVASAYPSRSIEGEWEHRCQLGHTHPFVVHAVALLGIERPAIGNLASLQGAPDLAYVAAMYGVELAAGEPTGERVVLTVRSEEEQTMPTANPRTVAAGVTTEDVRRAYYESAPWEMWIEEFHLDPLQLIVINDDDGTRTRVPVTASGDGADGVAFGEPVPVVVRYEDAGTTAVAAGTAPAVLRFASRDESRPSATRPPGAAVPGSTTTEERSPAVEFTDEQLTNLRQAAGLPDTATAEEIIAGTVEALGERAEPEQPATTPEIPEGTVLIEAPVLEELRAAAGMGRTALERQLREDREATVGAAIADGRVPPARRDHWLAALAADPEGTAQVLAGLQKGLVPVGAATGHADDVATASVRDNPRYQNWKVV